MSNSNVKVFINGSWVDLVDTKVYSNGSWIDLTHDAYLYVKSKVSNDVIRYPLAAPPLTLTANTDASSVTLNKKGDVDTTGILYRTSTDLKWRSYAVGTEIVLSNEGDYVQFKNSNTELSTSDFDYVYFSMTGSIAASGNIQSMLNYSDVCSEWCYYFMFVRCTALTQAPELPATTLATGCYGYMFVRCTALTQAPELPATTLATRCYEFMFADCTALTTAPALPATTLAAYCYQYMFSDCTSLTQAPALPATELAAGCYNEMFYAAAKLSNVTVKFTGWIEGTTGNWLSGVSSTGTFTKPSALPATTGSSNIPEGWTIVNT